MIRVNPSTVHGTTAAPASKSSTHRALLLGLLSAESTVRAPLLSADPLSTLGVVRALGASVVEDGPDLRVTGGRVLTPPDVLDCGNSGTTLRLATPIAALADGASVLTGDASLRKRPMQPLLDALRGVGVDAFSTRGDGAAPVVVRGPLAGGVAKLPGDVSSQYVSGLLLAGLLTPDGLDVTLTSPLKSRPYVDITLTMAQAFGGRIDVTDDGFHVPGGQTLKGADHRVPGDWSSAAFPLAAAAVTGGTVTVTNVDPRSPQGDKRIVDVLRDFGCDVRVDGAGVTVTGGDLRAVEVDLADTPDMFPVLAAVAAHAHGASRFTGAAHLRFKESDRIHAMAQALTAMGVTVEERDDGAIVHGAPGRVRAAHVETHHDHRILMAGVVAGLAADGTTTMDDDESFAVSYPDFPVALGRLGAHVGVVR